MNVLVTGAGGFFGSATVPRLERDGHRVTPLRRADVDLRDASAARAALAPWRWDAVVHLAGPAPKVTQEWSDAADTISAHVQMTLAIVSAIPASWPGRFVHASGMIVYGTPASERVREDHPRRPLHPYALAKCLAEDVLLASALRDRWLLRTGGLFSEVRRSGAIFAFARGARAGEDLRVTTAPPVVPWEILHVDDAADAVARALGAPRSDPGPVNVGYGEPIHIVDIADRFARRASGSPVKVILAGDSPPTFHADVEHARALGIAPMVSLDERLDAVWRSLA